MTTETMQSPRRLMRQEEPEWLVWVLVIVMLAIGLLARTIVESRTQRFTQANMSLRYPAGWVSLASNEPNEVLYAGESFETTLYPATVRVLQMPVTDISTMAQSLGDLALKWSNKQTQELPGYKIFSMEPTTVRGREGVKIDYAFIAEPLLGGPNSVPIVAHALDVLMREGDTVTVVTLSADASSFEAQATTWNRILGSLELK